MLPFNLCDKNGREEESLLVIRTSQLIIKLEYTRTKMNTALEMTPKYCSQYGNWYHIFFLFQDSCYESSTDPPGVSQIDTAVRLCVTVVNFAPESKRAVQMVVRTHCFSLPSGNNVFSCYNLQFIFILYFCVILFF